MSMGGMLGGLGIIGSIFGGIIQSNAYKKAGAANERANRETVASVNAAKGTTRKDFLAQIEIGQRAGRTLAGTATPEGEALGDAEGLGLDRTFESERTDYLISQAKEAINQEAAKRGQAYSGAALEQIGRETTNIATGESQREIDLLKDLYNIGTGASQEVANADTRYEAIKGEALANIGSGNAQAKIGSGKALASILSGSSQAAFGGAAFDKWNGGLG